MYGRILSVEVIDADGNATYIVDPEQETRLMCSGTIEYLPASAGSPRMTLQIYNLPSTISAKLFEDATISDLDEDGSSVSVVREKLVRVSFGYEDEDYGLQTIFIGSIVRSFTTRYDATTTITKVYAYQLGNLINSCLSSAQFNSGDTLYDCCEQLLDYSGGHCSYKIEFQIPDVLQKYRIDSDLSFYGKTVDGLTNLVSKVGYMVAITPGGGTIIPQGVDVNEMEFVVLADYEGEGEDAKIVARSGLIGYPCMDSDGIRFSTLINPKIVLYSYVFLPNSIIIDNRDGFTPSAQFGATYDPAGLYRVTKLTTVFDSHTGQCKTDYIAVAAATLSRYAQ